MLVSIATAWNSRFTRVHVFVDINFIIVVLTCLDSAVVKVKLGKAIAEVVRTKGMQFFFL